MNINPTKESKLVQGTLKQPHCPERKLSWWIFFPGRRWRASGKAFCQLRMIHLYQSSIQNPFLRWKPLLRVTQPFMEMMSLLPRKVSTTWGYGGFVNSDLAGYDYNRYGLCSNLPD